MRNSFVLFVTIIISATPVSAGGIFTNTNQSASYIRMPSRGASLDIDAVYYNPAGLTRLAEGLHISLNNQYISQNRTITNNMAALNQNEFKGTMSVPVFPSVYAAYKTGNLAFSLGLNIIGGGGEIVYEAGLPSVETAVAAIVPALDRYGVTGYRNNSYFQGSSVYYSGQLGASFEMFNVVSVYGGARFVRAVNTYEGYLRNILVNTPEGWMKPGTYLREFVAPLRTGVQQRIILDAANSLDISTADSEVDVSQEGNAIAPIVGLSIKPNERLNIGVKYEFLTELELRNQTVADGTGLFPHRRTFRNDLPALLSFGAAYRATPRLNVAGSMHYFFDKEARYSGIVDGAPAANTDIIDNDFIEIALGAEYLLTDYLLVSGGFLRSQSGVNERFQSDISHSLSVNSLGVGGRLAISEMIAVNFGFMMSLYDEDSRRYSLGGVSVTESYNRDNMAIALGLDLRF
jgi:long-chain fatty acid transport protein